MVRLLALVALVAGCLELPKDPPRECSANADCNVASGEVCEEGTCWGDPPSGNVAFLISPPAERPDLVPREILTDALARNGDLQALVFDTPLKLAARIETSCVAPFVCDGPLDASVTVSRASLFTGGPGFKATVDADRTEGGASSLSVLVPRNQANLPYTVTIVPTPRGDDESMATLAKIVPPLRAQVFTVPAAGTLPQPFTLGGLDLPTVEGTLLAASGTGLANYRVVALGQWDVGATPTEVSTVAYTTSDGAFRLTLSAGLVGNVEVVARATAMDVTAPTLHLTNIPSIKAAERTLTQPMGLGAEVSRVVRIVQRDGSGAVIAVAGARVRVTGSTPTSDGGTATFATEATTDDTGNVTLKLLDGVLASSYRLDVVPPASATVSALYDQPFDLGVTEPLMLSARVRLRGVVRDARGEPLGGVTVAARPSYEFLWNLDAPAQTFLSSIPVSTAISNDNGEFIIWVEPGIASMPSSYDLAFDPGRTVSSFVRAPTFVVIGIPVPADQPAMTVPDVRLPDAAFVHGDVRDPDGATVQGAEVRVFRATSTISSACEATNAPFPCPEAALLLGRAATDANGVVELILPRD